MTRRETTGTDRASVPRSTNRWKLVVLALASVVAALTLGEVSVRVLLGRRMVLFPRFHSRAVYGQVTLRRLRPKTEFWHTSADGRWEFVTNAQGFRDTRDFSYAKAPGRLRVLSLGDSNTEGFEVRQDHTYSAVVERWLNLRGTDAEVMNAGVSGFGTAEVVLFLEHEGVKYGPDVVIYGLHDNDYDDNVRSGLLALDHDTLYSRATEYAPATAILDVINAIPPVRWLSQHSYLYSLGFNSVWDWYKALVLTRARAVQTREYAASANPPDEYETALMAALLRRLGEFCRQQGILLVILDIPAYRGAAFGETASAIIPPLRRVIQESADVVLQSDEVLERYRGATELHLPNGHHHINELAHAVLGIRAGEAIQAVQQTCGSKGNRLTLCALASGQQPVGK